jgi:hypothetical protein
MKKQKVFNCIMVVVLIVSAYCLKVESAVADIVFAISLAYLSCAVYANESVKAKEEKGKWH